MLCECRDKVISSFNTIVLLLLCVCATLFGSILISKGVHAQGRLKVLLVGDSYTAGNGARKVDGGTDNYGPKGCYRSNSNWGRKYVDQLNNLGYRVTLVNRACSGAVSNDLLYDNDMEQDGEWILSSASAGISSSDSDDHIKQKFTDAGYCPVRQTEEEYYRINVLSKDTESIHFECRRYLKAQLDYIDDSVDVVLMTLGGNDSRFSDIVLKCFAPIVSDYQTCAKQVNDSREFADNKEPGSYQENMKTIFSSLQSKLRSDSKVVLLNYPYLAKDDNFTLKDLLGPNTYEASKNVRDLGRLGDQVQASLIPQNTPDKAGIYYFDEIKNHFIGHEPDMADFWHNNADKWINTFGSRLPTEWFHFNPTGHQEVANTLYNGLEQKVNGFPLKTKLDYDVVFIYNQSWDANVYQVDDLAIKGITMGKIRDKVLASADTARFGIISYNMWGGSGGRTGPKTKLLQDFTPDIYQLSRNMPRPSNLLGETYKGELKKAIEMALDMKWRPGVKKLIYIVGKTKADDDIFEPNYYNDVIQKSLNLDPVAISPLMSANTVATPDSQAQNLAQSTAGSLVQVNKTKDYTSDWAASTVGSSTVSAPYAWAGEGLNAKVGEEVSLDAAGSYDASGIADYQWDVNGDGTYDISTSLPVSKYTYAQEYAGLITLRVTNRQGASATATFKAVVSKDGDSIASEQDNCQDDWNEDQLDADSDGIGDVCDEAPGIAGYLSPAEQVEQPEPQTETDIIDDETDDGGGINIGELPDEAGDSPKQGKTDDIYEDSTKLNLTPLDTIVAKSVIGSLSSDNSLNILSYAEKSSQKNAKKNQSKESQEGYDLNNSFSKSNNSSNGWRALFIAGSLAGIGSAIFLLNLRLAEEEEL